MSLTRAQLRNKLYNRGFGLGFARTATAIPTAQSIVTDAVAFQDASAGEGDYKGKIIYRPLATAANRIRNASVISGTSLTHEGLAYSGDGTVLDYEIVGLLHPDELNECITLAQRMVYFETYAPVFMVEDGDFGGASVSSPFDWTAAQVGTVATKVTTQATNFRGFKSLLLTAAGYTYSSIVSVTPGDILVHGGAARAEGGEYLTTYSLIDADDLSVLETLNFTNRNLQHFIRKTTIPAGTYRVKLKLQTSSTSLFDYLFQHPYGVEGRQIEAPSWLSEQWRLMGFGPADYGREIATRQFNVRSQHFNGYKRPKDFELHPLTEEANPYHVQINRRDAYGNFLGMPDADCWYHGLRPYSDIAALDDETDTTDAPEDLIIAACEAQISKMLFTKTEDSKWVRMNQQAANELAAQRVAQSRIEEEYERSIYIMGGRGGA